jgi:hypothetical protein
MYMKKVCEGACGRAIGAHDDPVRGPVGYVILLVQWNKGRHVFSSRFKLLTALNNQQAHILLGFTEMSSTVRRNLTAPRRG